MKLTLVLLGITILASSVISLPVETEEKNEEFAVAPMVEAAAVSDTDCPPSEENGPNLAEVLQQSLDNWAENQVIDWLLENAKTNADRQTIIKQYFDTYNEDVTPLIIAKGTTTDMKRLLQGLIYNPGKFRSSELANALVKGVNKYDTLVEILIGATDIKTIKDDYLKYQKVDLLTHINSYAKGTYIYDLLIKILNTPRKTEAASQDKATKAAQKLKTTLDSSLATTYKASALTEVLAAESYDQLKLIFKSYKELAGITINQVITKLFTGDYQAACLGIVERTRSVEDFYASRLVKFNINSFVRIVVTLREGTPKLDTVIVSFEETTDISFQSVIDTKTSGSLRISLSSLAEPVENETPEDPNQEPEI